MTRVIVIALFIVSSAVLYQNCSPSFIVEGPRPPGSFNGGSFNTPPGGGGINNPAPGGGTSEGQAFFTSKVLPVFQSQCNTCHIEPRFGGNAPLSIFGYGPMKAKLDAGGSATNNDLIKKMQNLVTHTGGNRCLQGINATPCKEIIEWWQTEYKTSAAGIAGSIDSIDALGQVYGWASSISDPNPITVLFYISDSPTDMGVMVGSVVANLQGPTNIGPSAGKTFSFVIPEAYRDGRFHYLHAFGGQAAAANLIPGTPKQFGAYVGRQAGRNYYEQTVRPAMMNRCSACHVIDYATQFYSLVRPSPLEGGTATNNQLINKPSGVEVHGGGNICGGQNGSPCSLFQEWWRLEFQ